tara:strand:- start:328 stop:537 length:210 start_codon:yes stop_codon:yes gene_type:complete
MKNFKSLLKNTISSKYNEMDILKSPDRSTNINILLNRVKLNRKNEIKKKFYFFVAASTGVFLFGFIIFS